MEKKDLSLEKSIFELQKKIQSKNCDHKNEIQEMKQDFQKLMEENVKQLKAENDISLKQKDEKINCLEEEINKLNNQHDDLIKLQTNFNNLKIEFNEKKGKTVSLEYELKKINSENKNDIEEIKQNFQKINDENVRKDEKINRLEVEIKKANDLTDKKIGDLFNFNNLYSVVSLLNNMVFVKIKNKWSEIDSQCCNNKCINTNKPIGNCIKGNGFGNIIDDENIKYLVGNGGYDMGVCVYAENSFKKPQNSFNYSLYYFEIKCKFERELNGSKSYMNIGLRNCCTNNCISYRAKYGRIYNEKLATFQLSTFSWKNDNIFGCGLVYPPINISNEFPYVFFTQNGKQIGKGVLLKDNFDSYKLRVYLECCSVEANFGNDLESKPFKYDISKHLILKEFY
uniref:Uncharacterized protein n=1 Tax=Meloidogyne enterolobii TaxID=390850 RepID=A0A6V7VX83_MELEN|nr:unnamed protein product [Meloidogyne enterolobii]